MWSVWFGVDDCDASVAEAVELGGTVVMPPNDMDFGRGAMIADPAGAVFGVGRTQARGARRRRLTLRRDRPQLIERERVLVAFLSRRRTTTRSSRDGLRCHTPSA